MGASFVWPPTFPYISRRVRPNAAHNVDCPWSPCAIWSRDVLKLSWLFFAGATLCWAPAFGQDADASSLKGVTRVRVVIEDISRDAERAGLTKAQLQSDVELWLRQKGITIDGHAPEQLYVDVDTANNSAGGYAY